MSTGKLPPNLEQLATRQGTEAARLRSLGQLADPCPWDGRSASLTRRRLAAAWSAAFLAGTPGMRDG